MDYRIDLDPVHRVIRLTVTDEIVTLAMAEDCYFRLSKITFGGGQYEAIYDLSAVTGTTIPYNLITNFARRAPSVPMGRTHVVVGKEPRVYQLARIYQMCREFRLGHRFEVVRTLREAYKIVGAGPKDFTVHLFPKDGSALDGVNRV
jgi:hypothetical protein